MRVLVGLKALTSTQRTNSVELITLANIDWARLLFQIACEVPGTATYMTHRMRDKCPLGRPTILIGLQPEADWRHSEFDKEGALGDQGSKAGSRHGQRPS